jgi:secreted Zn-dependent insulinase-like peptidase
VSFTSLTRAETVVERLLNAKEESEDEKEESGEDTPVRPSLIKRLMAPQSSFIDLELEEAKSLHRADFVKFVDLAFRPNGAVLVVDGDLNLESTEKMVRELFSDWRPSRDEFPPLRNIGALPPRQAKPEVIEAQEALVTEVRLACRLPPVTSPEQHGGIALLERALGLYFGDDLRIARGLTYGVSSSATAFKNEDNLLVVRATLDPRGKQAAPERFIQRLDELDGAVWDERIVDVARWRVAKGFMGTVATSPSVSRLLAGEIAGGASFEDTLALPLRLSSTPLKYVDEAWAACSDTLAIELEGERSSIEAVLKRRSKK